MDFRRNEIIQRIERFLRLRRLRDWCRRRERYLFIGALLAGFAGDLATFRYLNIGFVFLTLAGYLVLAGASIALLDAGEAGKLRGRFFSYAVLFAPFALQLSFGALLSAFVLFYFQSGSLAASWPFISSLVFLMVGNEIFRAQYARSTVRTSMYFFTLFAFANWTLPYLTHRIGSAVFLASGVLSVLVLALFRYGLHFLAPRLRRQNVLLAVGVAVIFVGMNALYFTHFIPPIPLVMRDGGVYHGVRRVGDGYQALAEVRVRPLFSLAPEQFHITAANRTAYVFSSVFSPASLDTDIVHEWQKRAAGGLRWQTVNSVSFPLVGGRGEGYRGYSWNARLEPGVWRVNVKTTGGETIGRVAFVAVEADRLPPLSLLAK